MMDWQNKILPLPEMEPLTEAERNDYLANIGQMLADGMSEDDAAYLVFGPPLELPAGASDVLWHGGR